MRRTESPPFGISLIFGFAVAVVLALVWATAAHANHTQRSADDQYGTPTPPSGPPLAGESVSVLDDSGGAVGSSGTGSGGAGPSGSAVGSSGTGSGGAPSGGGVPTGVAAAVTDVLPATGGLLLLLPLGVLALSGAGLVIIGRRSTTGRR